ncbi:hypothetical protein [Shewanella marina]|uniref:hypothetical protein n=1 Tax=Shewanella marina TaxID=487319 RepID=UPI0004729ED5|nr:hypothetical protein [Shewanella marina]
MTLVFLLPLIFCLLWVLFLETHHIPLAKGKKGFIYIIAISLTISLFLLLMMWITANQNLPA